MTRFKKGSAPHGGRRMNELSEEERFFIRQLYRLDRSRRGAFHSTHLLPGVMPEVRKERVVSVVDLLRDGLIEARANIVGTYGQPLVRITERGRAYARSVEGGGDEDGPYDAA